jgi:thymidylate synthase
MNIFSGQHFTLVYLDLIRSALSSTPRFEPSRVGSVLDMGPAVIELCGSGNRLCLIAARALNPFFALYELSWILSGSNSLSGLQYFIHDYGKFSDDNKTLYGAYGYRLRKYHGFDQIEKALALLKSNPSNRRASLLIWSSTDLGYDSLDIPCNQLVNLKVREGHLDLSVTNRSNDIYLGVPYNVLQYHALQTYLAAELNLLPGKQIHFIDSLHFYERDLESMRALISDEAQERSERRLDLFENSNWKEFVSLDHFWMTENFTTTTINTNTFMQVRNSYIMWKNEQRVQAVQTVPRSEIGLVALDWYVKRLGFDSAWLPKWYY